MYRLEYDPIRRVLPRVQMGSETGSDPPGRKSEGTQCFVSRYEEQLLSSYGEIIKPERSVGTAKIRTKCLNEMRRGARVMRIRSEYQKKTKVTTCVDVEKTTGVPFAVAKAVLYSRRSVAVV